MKVFTAIVIEDEAHIRDALTEMIIQCCPQIRIQGSVSSAEEGRKLLKKKVVDFIFLDIAMPEEDGFAFLDSIKREEYGVIFTTAYHEYALRALRVSAVDYLLKPVNPVELREAVTKAINNYYLRNHDAISKLIFEHSLAGSLSTHFAALLGITHITIAEQFGYKMINLGNVMYLEADSNYTVFHMHDENNVTATKNLGEFEKIIEHPFFFRIHKSYMINVNFIAGYSSFEGNTVELKNGVLLNISRRKFSDFRLWVKQFSAMID